MQFTRVIATLLAFAAVFTFATPIPAGSVQKKGLAAVDANILAREPESADSELGVLAREPCIGPPTMCF